MEKNIRDSLTKSESEQYMTVVMDDMFDFAYALGCNTLPEEKCKCGVCGVTDQMLGVEPKHNHSRGEAGCGVCVKRQKECEHKEYGNGLSGMECVDCGFVRDTSKEKELFDMVYQWGKSGIEVDEKCNAFQDLLREIKL